MRFSLVTCTRGRSREVAELFESLVRQKRDDFEVILVDQNPDERLSEIVQRFSNQFPIRHVRMQGTGASRARNEGIDYASGELIGFPDDDCQYLEGYLDAVDKIFIEDPSIGCISGNPTAELDKKHGDDCLIPTMDLDGVSVLNRCQEFTVFVRKLNLGSLVYNEHLGVGAGTPWGAEEGPDFLIRLIENQTRLVFFPNVFVYHPNKIEVVNRSTLKRASSYARGRGCLLRLHKFPLATIWNSVFRPAAGCGLHLLKLQPKRAFYYFVILVGTSRGLLISKADLAEVRSGSRRPVPPVRPVSLLPISSRPLVTVLIANYNYAHYLPATFDSLFAQTYTHWHAVVCDDGSTDDSVELIRKYAELDPRIELVQKSNGGQNSAFNAGYREVRGEIVCLLDADDTFDPSKLEQVVKHFRAYPDAGMCNHFSQVIDKSGNPRQERMHRFLDSGWQGDEALKRGACVYVPTTSCMSIRREIANLIFPVPVRQDRDLDGYLAMVAQFLAPIGVIHQQLSSYRIHDKNMGGLTEPTPQRLRYELHLIKLRTSNVKEFVRQRLGERVSEQITMEENPQYIQAALKLLAIERRGGGLPRPLDLIRQHPNAKWRAFWRLIFAAPPQMTRLAVPYMHRSHRIKAFFHRLTGHGQVART